MNQQQPYRVPAPMPAKGPNSPTRTIGIVANVVSLFIVLGSFGGCMKWGCQTNHLSDGVGTSLVFGSGFACVICALVAIVVFAKAGTDKTKDSAASTVGIVFSVLWGISSALMSAFFWICTTQDSMNFIGGWGRPLRLRRRALTPAVKSSTEWAKGPRPDVKELDVGTRAILRDLWLHDARKEHASVPAFGQVAWQLIALGAPSDLVRRAHLSCLQEIDHAERCFALASAYAGEDLGVQEMPALHRGGAALPNDRLKALTKVAVEALVDGALLEDFNAQLAATALPNVRDEACREALVRIVEDESDHARLAWDIIAFCVERGGPIVIAALEKRFAAITLAPTSLYEAELDARVSRLADKTILWAHGRVNGDCALDVFRERHAYCRGRLSEITGLRAAA